MTNVDRNRDDVIDYEEFMELIKGRQLPGLLQVKNISSLYCDDIVTRPLCLVKPRSQNAAANVGVLSVCPTTILYYHHQLFFDIEQESIYAN